MSNMKENISNNPNPTQERAFEFYTPRNLMRTLTFLEELAQQDPTISYDPIDDRAIVIPESVYGRLKSILDKNKIRYVEMEVISMSDLPHDEQLRVRHLNRPKD